MTPIKDIFLITKNEIDAALPLSGTTNDKHGYILNEINPHNKNPTQALLWARPVMFFWVFMLTFAFLDTVPY